MGGAAPEPAPPWGLFRGFPFLGHLGGSDFGDFRLHAPPSLFFRDCFRRFECSCPPSPLFSGLISLILVCLGTVFGTVLGDFVFRRSRRFFIWTVFGIVLGDVVFRRSRRFFFLDCFGDFGWRPISVVSFADCCGGASRELTHWVGSSAYGPRCVPHTLDARGLFLTCSPAT